MKSCLNVLVGVSLLGLVSEIHADNRWFVDRPEFMSGVDTIHCEVERPQNIFNRCGVGDGNHEQVLYTNGRDVWVEGMDDIQQVTCRGGLCQSDTLGYVGRLDYNISVTIPVYYYIGGGEHTGDRRTLVLHKRGTGPYSDHIQGWLVENDDQAVASANKEILAFFCDQGAVDECFVRFEDMSEGWLTGAEVATQFDPVDPNDPEYDMLGVECGASGACDTMRGGIVGYDPNHPAFQ